MMRGVLVRGVIVVGGSLTLAAVATVARAQTTAVPYPPPAWLTSNPHSEAETTPTATPDGGTASPTNQSTGTAAQTSGRFSSAQRFFSRMNGTRDGWTPRIGSITSGSGVAFGATYQQPVLGGKARLTTDGMYSIRGYSALEIGAFTTPFEQRSLMLGARLRHEYYPQEDFYGIGAGSGRGDHTSYLRQGLDMTAFVTVAPRSWLNVEGSAGFLDMRVGSGKQSGIPSIVDRFDAASAPGLGANADMAHVGLAVEVDRRDEGFFPRSGGRYFAGITAFHGLADFHGTFTRTDVDLRQYLAVPKTSSHVIAVRSQFAFSGGAGDRVSGTGIPFYMLPRLGGSSTLRAYETSRFTDRHAMAFTVEHRWLVTPRLQLVGFADAGKVAPSLGDLDFSGLRTSVGAGVRFKIRNAAVARLDFATGKEGSRWIIGFGPSF